MKIEKELSKVEGHAKLFLEIEKNRVKKCFLEVFESPRYFEALIKNRKVEEAPYFAQRICGVCNVAHLFGCIYAIEDALGIEIGENTKMLRELMVMGGIIHSHALHLYFLALPDFLNKESILEFDKNELELVKKGLEIKEVGNRIVEVIGGRAIHPVTATIGKFTKLPKNEELKNLKNLLEENREKVIETIEMFSSFNFPEAFFDTPMVAVFEKNCYQLLKGDLIDSEGKIFLYKDYKNFLKEKVVEYSTSKHVFYKGKVYLVGPLSRIFIKWKSLTKEAKKYAIRQRLNKKPLNIFSANVARAIELLHFFDKSIELIERVELKEEKPRIIGNQKEKGISITEAPRGVLIYDLSIKNGKIKEINIITPTAQNVAHMEFMIKNFLKNISDNFQTEVEKLIRAYDPCFSCSAHFLEIEFIKETNSSISKSSKGISRK